MKTISPDSPTAHPSSRRERSSNISAREEINDDKPGQATHSSLKTLCCPKIPLNRHSITRDTAGYDFCVMMSMIFDE